MACCARFCAVLVALIAIAVGLVGSGSLAGLDLGNKIEKAITTVYGSPDLVGLAPVFVAAKEYSTAFKLDDVPSLEGKLAVVTGGNVGLGYATAQALAEKGADVIITCRNWYKCTSAAKAMNEAVGSERVSPMVADLSDFSSVEAFGREFAFKHKKLHIFVANAALPGEAVKRFTIDDNDEVIQVNHISHHMMYRMLEPSLLRGAEDGLVRVVIVSSAASLMAKDIPVSRMLLDDPSHYSQFMYYAYSKSMNILFSRVVNQRLGEKGIANACHPGMVATNIWRKNEVTAKQMFPEWFVERVVVPFFNLMEKNFMWSREEGALTQVALATVATTGGDMYHPIYRKLEYPNPHVNDTLAKELWDFTEEVIKSRNINME